jgi:hypothetical protein
MSTSASTQSAMYHGVDFWKIVAWVKDELAARLNSFVRWWDSSSKTLRLTVGSGVFQLARRSRKGAGLDRHQRRRVLFGCSQATSHSECGLSTGIRIRHDLLRFGLLHSHRRSSSDANWPHGGGQLPKCSARGDPSLRRVSPAAGPSPRGPAAPPQGRRATALDRIGMGRLNRRVWEAHSLSTRRMEIRRSAPSVSQPFR